MIDSHSLECLDFLRIRELLAGYAQCGLGKALANNIKPLNRSDLIRRWLDQVIELRTVVDELGLPPFAGISDVRDVIDRCAPPLRVTVDDIARIGAALQGTHNVVEWLAKLPQSCPELRHLQERIGDFRAIAQRVARVIDERGEVRDEASPKLRRIRAEISEATGSIRSSVDELLRDPNVRRWLQYVNFTFHNDRLVLPVRTEYRGRVPGIVHRHSDSGATIYVEPTIAVELNNQISNLKIEESEEINRLLWELAHEIHQNADEIRKTLEALAVIDLIVAKFRIAKEFGYRCPELNDEGRLDVRGARHPLLLEMQRQRRLAGELASEVVPIDYRLGGDFDLMIITGPNTGGKTVTLKTIGLLTLMVQSGMPVPVGDGSNFGMLSNVFIDIGDEQNMQQSLSTFSAHLKRSLDIVKRSGNRTLVLVDELGAGTDPEEGAAIGRAILDELLRLGARCVVTTHLGALKAFALSRDRVENANVEFDIETLRPTYKLTIGEPGNSNAIDIAQRLGMPQRLVAAARRNLSHNARDLRAALAGTSVVKRQAEDARREAEDAKLHASRAAGEAEAAKQKFESEQANYRTWVQRVVHLQPGDPVRIRNFDRDGKIIRIRMDLQRAEVDVGAFSVEAPLGDVLPPETPAPPPKPLRPPPPITEGIRPRGQRREQRPEGVGPVASGPRNGGGGRAPGAAPRTEQRQQPPRDNRPPRPERTERPGPPVKPITEEQAAALKPGDRVYAKTFHRVGTVVRVRTDKKIVLLSVGVLEVEVPFSGLGEAAMADDRR